MEIVEFLRLYKTVHEHSSFQMLTRTKSHSVEIQFTAAIELNIGVRIKRGNIRHRINDAL